ncbi:MAG: glycerophosphodiester phosphodiesterase family protein [Dermatophilaceae bacterium]|nr:glycerophosphodiester phosphodiesterase [Intrasporangiaceae bacterium]
MLAASSPRPTPHVYGHRGAPGYVPENTLGSYALAASMGVEAIELDLVCTKDGRLVARHEPNLAVSTDVATRPEFADRWREIAIGERVERGWFTVDFTLEELRTLHAGEPWPDLRGHTLEAEGEWRIPSFDDILACRAAAGAARGRDLGVIVEIKRSSLFHLLGFDPEAELLASLGRHGVSTADPLLRLESFETSNLRRLREELGFDGSLVFLAEDTGGPLDHLLAGDPRTYADLLTPSSLEELAGLVDVIAPKKHLVIGRTADDRLADPTPLVADAHAVGLEVTPWSFRAENHFLPAELRGSDDPAEHGDLAAELTAFFDAGVDGVFCDQPDLAIAARDDYLRGSEPR